MQLLLIVVPCTLVGLSVGFLLDRAGVLPRLGDSGPASAPPRLGALARPVSLGTIVILATWILAWLVLLGVGLNIILSAT